MKIKEVSLETVCGITSTLPKNHRPEVAFAGKSNVGKSSLINALMMRKSLARTSSQPGKTQTINFYNVNNELYFVDLPGYGFARANIKAKEQWGTMIERYLQSSEMLAAIFLLTDIRHEPGEHDRMMYHWIRHQGYRPVIIATKADKLKRSRIPGQISQVRKGLGADQDTVIIPFSAETKQGREEIYALLDGLLEREDKEETS